MLRLILCFALLASVAQADQTSCSIALTGDARLKTVVNLVEKLNPELLNVSTLSLEALYLRLKNEEWKYNKGQTLPEELKQLLISSQGKHYNLSGAADSEVTMFYLNALRALYIRVAEAWKVQAVQKIARGVLIHQLHDWASSMVDALTSPYTLQDVELTPEAAAEILRNREFADYPWAEAIELATDWVESHPNSASVYDFGKWAGDQPAFNQMTASQQNKLINAIGKSRGVSLCCKAQPGCLNCPHNRRWLNIKSN